MIRRVTDEVSRKRLNKLLELSEGPGDLEEKIVAEAFGLVDVSGDDAEDADLRNPRTEARYEVKSTRVEIGAKYPAAGRFRLWEDQHRSIVGYDAQPDLAGWYVFLAGDDDGTPQVMRRVEPSTVTRLVDGEWNEAGHDSRESRQFKLPIEEIFTDLSEVTGR